MESKRAARGMNSELLSARAIQPGDDRTFEESESQFILATKACLPADRYRVEAKPSELRDLFGERSGVVPEASITSLATGRKFFVEVKKQGAAGNAEERACKHHTVQFYKCLHERFGYAYHPYVTIFCESLATNPRYTRKVIYLYEPDQYLLWVDYDRDILKNYLVGRCAAWLDN